MPANRLLDSARPEQQPRVWDQESRAGSDRLSGKGGVCVCVGGREGAGGGGRG